MKNTIYGQFSESIKTKKDVEIEIIDNIKIAVSSMAFVKTLRKGKPYPQLYLFSSRQFITSIDLSLYSLKVIEITDFYLKYNVVKKEKTVKVS